MQSHINIGSGKEVSIKELAEKIMQVVGFNGTLILILLSQMELNANS